MQFYDDDRSGTTTSSLEPFGGIRRSSSSLARCRLIGTGMALVLFAAACTDTSPNIETASEASQTSLAPDEVNVEDRDATTLTTVPRTTTSTPANEPTSTGAPIPNAGETSSPLPDNESQGPSCGDPVTYSLADDVAEAVTNPIADELNLVEPDPLIKIDVVSAGTAPCFDLEYQLPVGTTGFVSEQGTVPTVVTAVRVIDSIEGYVLLESIVSDGATTTTTLELVTRLGLRIGTRGPSGPVPGEIPSPDGSLAILPPAPLGVGAQWRLSLGTGYIRTSELIEVDGDLVTISSEFDDGLGISTGSEQRQLYLDKPTAKRLELSITRDGESTSSLIVEASND